jgi:Domain of unknown function (DUF4112)
MKVLSYNETSFGSRKIARTTAADMSLDRLSWLMDDLFRVPGLGWRFGLDALVGLIPGFGDTATSLVSFYILVAAVRQGVPKITITRMAVNVALDYLIGSLPFVGDLFDAWWKSNQKNVALLKERATIDGAAAREGNLSDWLFVGTIIVGLIGLAVGSALVSFYLLLQITQLLFGN